MRKQFVLPNTMKSGCANPLIGLGHNQIGENRTLHLALQPAHRSFPSGDGVSIFNIFWSI